MNTKTFSPTVSVLIQESGFFMPTKMRLVELSAIWQKLISIKNQGTKMREYYRSKFSLVIIFIVAPCIS